ncbi:unnamed protein product [Rhizopus stolonifer]
MINALFRAVMIQEEINKTDNFNNEDEVDELEDDDFQSQINDAREDNDTNISESEISNKDDIEEPVLDNLKSHIEIDIDMQESDNEEIRKAIPPVWKRGLSEYSVFFNLSRLQQLVPEAGFYQAVRDCLPVDRFIGARTHKGPNKGLLVEFFVKSEEDCQQLVQNGIKIGERHIRPFRSLPPDSNVTQVHLSDLPFTNCPDYTTKLNSVLSQFGQVLHLSLNVEKHSGIFAGTGSVTLSTPLQANLESGEPSPISFIPLTHEIDFDDYGTFRANWRNMPAYCRYCHKSDHFKKDCTSRPNNSCRTCGKIGHTSIRCEHGQRTASRKKAKISTSVPRTILHRPISQGKLKKDAIQSSSVPRDSSGLSVSALQSKFATIPNTAETSSTTIHVEQQQSEASNYYPDSNQPLISETESTLQLTELPDHDGARDAEKTSTNSELEDEVMMDSETNQPSGSEPASQSTGIQPVQQQRQAGITSVHKAGGPIRSSSRANKSQHPKRNQY